MADDLPLRASTGRLESSGEPQQLLNGSTGRLESSGPSQPVGDGDSAGDEPAKQQTVPHRRKPAPAK